MRLVASWPLRNETICLFNVYIKKAKGQFVLLAALLRFQKGSIYRLLLINSCKHAHTHTHTHTHAERERERERESKRERERHEKEEKKRRIGRVWQTILERWLDVG